jgi:hypothetical protein
MKHLPENIVNSYTDAYYGCRKQQKPDKGWKIISNGIPYHFILLFNSMSEARLQLKLPVKKVSKGGQFREPPSPGGKLFR